MTFSCQELKSFLEILVLLFLVKFAIHSFKNPRSFPFQCVMKGPFNRVDNRWFDYPKQVKAYTGEINRFKYGVLKYLVAWKRKRKLSGR